METIGERIRRLRKNVLDKTQKEFGSQIGLKPNSVSDIESGKNNPTEQTIKAICREFSINEDWIRNGKLPMEKYSDIDEYSKIAVAIGEKDPKAVQAIIKYWKLSENDKKLFWNFVERFIEKKGH